MVTGSTRFAQRNHEPQPMQGTGLVKGFQNSRRCMATSNLEAVAWQPVATNMPGHEDLIHENTIQNRSPEASLGFLFVKRLGRCR